LAYYNREQYGSNFILWSSVHWGFAV
jgi:hypothetical protein